MLNITGSNIKKYREERKITQEQMVQKLRNYGLSNITQGAISRIESQVRNVNDIELQAFSCILNVPITELMKNNPEDFSNDNTN